MLKVSCPFGSAGLVQKCNSSKSGRELARDEPTKQADTGDQTGYKREQTRISGVFRSMSRIVRDTNNIRSDKVYGLSGIDGDFKIRRPPPVRLLPPVSLGISQHLSASITARCTVVSKTFMLYCCTEIGTRHPNSQFGRPNAVFLDVARISHCVRPRNRLPDTAARLAMIRWRAPHRASSAAGGQLLDVAFARALRLP